MPFVDGLALSLAAWSRILDRGQPRNSRQRRSVASAKSFPATEGSKLGRSQAQAGRQDTYRTVAYRRFLPFRREWSFTGTFISFDSCLNLAQTSPQVSDRIESRLILYR